LLWGGFVGQQETKLSEPVFTAEKIAECCFVASQLLKRSNLQAIAPQKMNFMELHCENTLVV